MKQINVIFYDSEGIAQETAWLHDTNALLSVYADEWVFRFFSGRDLCAEHKALGTVWVNVDKDAHQVAAFPRPAISPREYAELTTEEFVQLVSTLWKGGEH